MKSTLNFFLAAAVTAVSLQPSVAQEDVRDPNAKVILDKLAEKNKGMKSIKLDFSYTLIAPEVEETQEGTMYMKGERYRVDLAGQSIVSDGKFLYTILDGVEVQVNNLPEEGEAGWMNPKSLLSINESDFKYRLDGEETEGGKTLQKISLWPENANDKSFHTIVLLVDKEKVEPYSITIKSKDGNQYIIRLKNYSPDAPFSDSLFIIKEADYDDWMDMTE